MEPIRILQVVMIMNRGGAETMIMNYYRKLDKTKYQFDFLVHREEKGVYDDEIRALGGKIYVAPRIFPGNYGKYKRFLKNFLKEHTEFSAIHSHIQENSGFILYYAKKLLPQCVRVSHSHIAKIDYDFKYPFRLYANKYLKKADQIKLACGTNAGKLFYKSDDFTVFKNAIDTKKFVFSSSDRELLRKEWGIEKDEILIGSIARLNKAKNHSFMIDLCEMLDKKYKLVAVGTGELRTDLENKVKAKGLENRFIFAGLRTDVERCLSAIDIFIMPSFYEGLPVSGIEAQANGLTCLFSDAVDTGTDITGNCSFLPLELNTWKKAVENSDITHRNTTKAIVNAGYDVESNLGYLIDLYTNKRV